MTVKELEARTGLDRATVRYYEKEGLIKPRRLPNGYRDYSEEDALALEKIVLLRRLDLPLEDIRRVQSGELPLGVALDVQEEALQKQEQETFHARRILEAIREDGASYETLEPNKIQRSSADSHEGRRGDPAGNVYRKCQPSSLAAVVCPLHRLAAVLAARYGDRSLRHTPASLALLGGQKGADSQKIQDDLNSIFRAGSGQVILEDWTAEQWVEDPDDCFSQFYRTGSMWIFLGEEVTQAPQSPAIHFTITRTQ